MWSPESHLIKDFLSRNQMPYQWVDLEVEHEVRELVEHLTPGLRDLPVVLFPDGHTIIGPDLRGLAEKIGLQTKAQRPFYDLIVAGAARAAWRPRSTRRRRASAPS